MAGVQRSVWQDRTRRSCEQQPALERRRAARTLRRSRNRRRRRAGTTRGKREADTAIEELDVERVIDVEDLVDAPMGDAAEGSDGDPSSASCAAVASLDIGALDASARGVISEAKA